MVRFVKTPFIFSWHHNLPFGPAGAIFQQGALRWMEKQGGGGAASCCPLEQIKGRFDQHINAALENTGLLLYILIHRCKADLPARDLHLGGNARVGGAAWWPGFPAGLPVCRRLHEKGPACSFVLHVPERGLQNV